MVESYLGERGAGELKEYSSPEDPRCPAPSDSKEMLAGVARTDDDWGVRLADVRVPSWYYLYALALTLASLVGTLRKRRAWGEASRSAREVTSALAERMVEGDRRDQRVAELTEHMADLTQRMESYGRTSVKLARASLAVAMTALIVAIAAAVLAG